MRRHHPGLLTSVLLAGLLAGCNDAPVSPETADPPAPDKAAVEPAEARLKQTFAQATRSDPPDGWHRPPDVTLAGKPTGPLYTEVIRQWDMIPFRTPAGRTVQYQAVLETELGSIEIAFRPDLAPNHVRNFVALARAGFFDGLVFQRAVREKVEGHPDVELIEGGCPLGTGEAGHGAIGYWLNQEFSKEPQDEGTVGACHTADDPDTAACKFYILLNKAAILEGHYTVFGKVVAGLDVARKIHAQPLRTDGEYPELDRPVKPVGIRKVTIQTREVDTSVAR